MPSVKKPATTKKFAAIEKPAAKKSAAEKPATTKKFATEKPATTKKSAAIEKPAVKPEKSEVSDMAVDIILNFVTKFLEKNDPKIVKAWKKKESKLAELIYGTIEILDMSDDEDSEDSEGSDSEGSDSEDSE